MSSALAQTAINGISVDGIHADTFRVIIPGIVFGFIGGAVATILSWGRRDKTWGARASIVSIVAGTFVGSVSSLILASQDHIEGPYAKMAVMSLAGFIGQKLLEKFDKAGPGLLWDWVARRIATEPPPSIVPPPSPPESKP